MVRPTQEIETLPQPPRFISHDELTQRGTAQRLFKPSSDPPATGRLSHQAELVLFKRMQYCGYRMSKMWDRLDRLNKQEQRRYLELNRQYTDIRERIVEANMGLVFDLLGKTRFKNADFDEMRSEGLMALLRSVDTYNPWSGYRFSTYACNSILNAFSRVALMESKRSHLWANSYDPKLEPTDPLENKRADQVSLLSERVSAIIHNDNDLLSENERYVLKERFPMRSDQRKATLKKLGESLKVSKERVRQIQASALSKVRRLLLTDSLLQ
jgi:RNA polymerase sigma factor (sigma-70 family)